ncbi:MAG: T9SS type A sorting domain-containing protein [Candidatus Krumholzibacteria bacterium]|nr:T9SS type A sorting domain-containing protein [Candidatus Krumholzibacteria bacterium]
MSVGVDDPPSPLTGQRLEQNVPNPFNPSTRIAFELSAPAHVSLRIYDAAGRFVRALVEGNRPAGIYSEMWDGRDSNGRAVASGVYFYRIVAGPFESTKKMILLR